MPLELRLRANQGIPFKQYNQGREESSDIIVRKIKYNGGVQVVDFEVRRGGSVTKFRISEGESYLISDNNSILIPYTHRSENEPLRKRGSVFVSFDSPRTIVFGDRQFYLK